MTASTYGQYIAKIVFKLEKWEFHVPNSLSTTYYQGEQEKWEAELERVKQSIDECFRENPEDVRRAVIDIVADMSGLAQLALEMGAPSWDETVRTKELRDVLVTLAYELKQRLNADDRK